MKNIGKDILFNFILTILSTIFLFLINKIFLNYMGVKNLGLMKLFTQMIAYFNLLELGVASATSYALYKPLNEKNIEKISIILNTISNLYRKICTGILIIGITITPTIKFFIKEEINQYIYIYWILYVISTVLSYITVSYTVLFTADQRYNFVKGVQSLSKIFCQICQLIVIIRLQSFFVFILIMILENLIQYIIYKCYYIKKYNFILKINKKDYSILKNLKYIFWHKIGGVVILNTDYILISRLISLEIVGIYASYQMIIQGVLTIFHIIYGVLGPKIGKFISENKKEKIYLAFKKINIFFLFFSFIFSYSTYILLPDFIKLWIGKEFLLTKTTLVLITINLMINCFRWIIELFKSGSGFFDDVQVPILESTINLVFSIILGIKYGINGIIIGTIISNITIILIYKPILVFRRCFDKNIKEYIKVYGKYCILLVISLFCLNTVIKPFIKENIDNWIQWIIYAVKISLITGIVLFLIFLLDKDFKRIIKNYIFRRNKIEE